MGDFLLYAQGTRTPEWPVLFLDVDGVLNCEDDFRAGYSLCQSKVRLLNLLPPCDIVISSTWRIGTYPHLVAALRWLGCKKAVIDKTPESWRWDGAAEGERQSSMRGDEIKEWLGANGNPRFAIVDDDSDMLPEQLQFFVQTTFMTGITPVHVAKLAEILAEKP